ncbi:MAG: GMC family oxidoreductase [Deltaproteobacteria bacterium]|nr:GMC family oxidoreductase [Deltaproteobacteria bacterium]MBW1911341.1 GMC family oxidoreductase [Deltaproteobacteria bacterium]MBW2035086.1 GMC family oxidoreductase [Deltaproteobacteria bacterium]MBW2115772.1 GMC family oxidoreductase [Deltaproteobacteria bacterium]
MIINSQHFDAIVVGSGSGGATVAKELTERNKKVLILEWGSNAPIKGTKWQALGMSGIPGRSLLFTYGMLATVRAIATGGSSVFYYATAFDPPFDMLRSYGVDITEEINEAKRELPISPLSDDLVGPMAKMIMQSARDIGYDWHKLPKIFYQDKCKSECWRCNYGCPYGAKWNAHMYIKEAVDKGAELINRAKVKKVIVDNRKATGVEFAVRGIRHKAFAQKVVLSAGGIGSPVILRASGVRNAGNDYFFDPLIAVMGTVKDIKGGKEIPMATGVDMEDEGYLMTDMTVPAFLYAGFTAEVFRFHRLFSHSRTLQIMVKAKDSLGGRLTNSGGVRKRLTESDKQKLLKGYERAKAILRNAGAKNIFKSWYIAAHPGGTVRINDLIDSNLQTEYENLYVCDCSVIPEAWGLPPTLTLIGLGKRLAKYLTGETKTAGKNRDSYHKA